MEYKSTVTVSVITNTRTSGFNSDGTMRGTDEEPRIVEHVKRIINLPKDCLLERGKYHVKLWQGEEEGISTPENPQAKETTRKLVAFLNDVKDAFANSEAKWAKWVELFQVHLTDEALNALEETLHE